MLMLVLLGLGTAWLVIRLINTLNLYAWLGVTHTLATTRAALIGLRRLSTQDVAGAAAKGRVMTGSSRMRSVRPAARMPSSPAAMKAGA